MEGKRKNQSQRLEVWGLGSEPLAEGVQPEGSHELTTAALGLWELSLGLGKTKAILMG